MKKPPTEARLRLLYFKRNMGIKDIAKALGYSHEGIRYRMKTMGIVLRKPTHASPKGKASPFWKGGITHAKGYKFVKMSDHPQASPNGYVSEHRLQMEKKLNRRLKRGEHVHHIDGNILNNAQKNLFPCFAKKHRELENELIRIGMQLFKNDIVKFEKGHYVLCES